MLENYIADKPITLETEDKFQRFNFSKRIAQTIVQRKSKESIVFGLFGAWGEGKSSVINFIDKELKNDTSIITIHLNPWRYTDEDSLLLNFFEKISLSLEKDLKTGLEKVARKIERYGALIRLLGLEKDEISKALSDTTLEDFKERVDKLLNETTKRLVIFIDDIDRLDKNEISTLFRLIKLTADFTNTIYILSFDESMVASAIGGKFGEGDKKAGENFLEKIIQVPLTIPKAQPEALKKFCFELVENALNSNDIKLSEDEVGRFVFRFTSNLLNRLNTPRLAVRYSNTLSFSLPLLYKEVNTIDLMLIEGIKIFYPEYYNLVKENPDLFLGSYSTTHRGVSQNQAKIDLLNDKLNHCGQSYKVAEKENVIELLTELFPKLKTAFQNYHFSNSSYEEWKSDKRIASSSYFNRYFSYSVIEGEISDIEFELLISNIGQHSIETLKKEMLELINKSTSLKFIEKLQPIGKNIEWNESKKICLALCELSANFDSSGSIFNLGFDSSLKQAVIFIYGQLEKYRTQNDLFTFCIDLLTQSSTLKFTTELIVWYNSGEEQNKILNTKQLNEVNKILISKILSSLDENENIFTKYPEESRRLLDTWYTLEKLKSKNYVNEFLNLETKNIITFLWAFAPTMRSTSHPKPYKGDLSKESFENISTYVSYNKIKSLLRALYGKLNINDVIWDDVNGGANGDKNVALQFLYHLKSLINQQKQDD